MARAGRCGVRPRTGGSRVSRLADIRILTFRRDADACMRDVRDSGEGGSRPLIKRCVCVVKGASGTVQSQI